MKTNTICPVCGRERAAASSSPACSTCGFSYAYVPYFSSQNAFILWKDKVQAAKEKWSARYRQTISSAKFFWMGDREVAYLDRDRSVLYVIEGNGLPEQFSDAAAFSSSERNYAVLYKNGSVRVFGSDNEFGQKDTGAWTDIRYILSAPHCTYGITEAGEIIYAGSLTDPSVRTWKNVRKLAAGSDLLAALHTDGRVSVCQSRADRAALAGSAAWRDIADIAVSKDAVIGLTKEGTVKFSGRESDPKQKAEEWKNITAVAADNTYVYGMTENGRVLCAGKFNKMLDRGRSRVSEWENAAALSANNAGVSIITADGELKLAGTLTGDIAKVRESWQQLPV